MTIQHPCNDQSHNSVGLVSSQPNLASSNQSISSLSGDSSQRDEFPIPPAVLPLVLAGFDIYLQVWNILVGIDRQGGALNTMDLRSALADGIRAILIDEEAKWLPFAEAVVREYQAKRTMCRKSLRFKNENRLSTIPMDGPLTILGLDSYHDRRILRRKDGAIVVIQLLPRDEE